MGRATGKNNKELGALQLMQGLLGTIGSAGRGLVAGTAGLPGDIESLVRLLPGFSEKTILPTTEEVSGALPKLPAAYRQPVAEGMGQMGAMTPGQVAKLGRAGKAGALALMDRALTPSRVAQAGAVKPRGGNWLESGGLEYLRDLPGETNPEALARMRAMAGPEAGLNQEHLGKWVNGALTNYVKRDLGTVNDPLLKLADEGISTLPKEQLLNPPFWAKTSARENRKMSGIEQPELGGYAQGWSDLADGMVRPDKAGDVRRNMGSWLEQFTANEPGFGKIPDDAMTYQFGGDEAPWHLGFDTLVDSLRTGMDHASNLPPGLRLKPEDLQQMGMERAVRYMNNVENFKAVEAERQAARQLEAMGKQGTLHKEFPTGHRIVDLNKPEKLDDEMAKTIRQNADGTFSPIDADGKVVQRRNTLEGRFTDVVENDPETAYLGGMLANEGNAMQQCLGGYCNDVAGGRTKIYSVRSAKGEPHVTIETVKGYAPAPDFYDLLDTAPPELMSELTKTHGQGGIGWAVKISTDPRWIEHAKQFEPPEPPWEVSQVYGKQNTKPKDEFLPMIQDFIRSGKYSVGDSAVLENSGLRDVSEYTHTTQELAKQKYPGQKYFTDDELSGLMNNSFDDTSSVGYAEGGLVEIDDDFSIPGHF